jgi:hypothetical protein
MDDNAVFHQREYQGAVDKERWLQRRERRMLSLNSEAELYLARNACDKGEWK